MPTTPRSDAFFSPDVSPALRQLSVSERTIPRLQCIDLPLIAIELRATLMECHMLFQSHTIQLDILILLFKIVRFF